MKRAHVSPLLLGLTAVISLSCGIGITLIAEDLVGVPLAAIDPEDLDLPDNIKEMLMEDILEWLENHPDAELPEDLVERIKELIEKGDYSLEDLQKMLEEHPELAPVLGTYLQDYIDNLTEKEEGEEPSYTHNHDMAFVDDGTLDPDADQTELFTVESTYRGQVYIRNTSYGDYVYGKGAFDEAPSFDGSTYIVSPLLFTGFAFERSGWSNETLTFHLPDSYSDYGMLVGDYCGTGYYKEGETEVTRFSKSVESRIRRTGAKDYRVSFYPDHSPKDASLPTYLVTDEENYYAYARANYLNVPEEMSSFLGDFIASSSLMSNSTPKEVETFFKNNYSYEAMAFSPSVGEDTVVSFLQSGSKVGTCTNFASAMTLLCRYLGKPSRLVGGYCIDATMGENSVKENDAHAWVEVYESGHGWVRYDPTPEKKSRVECEKNAGSNGEVGDKAYDPSKTETLFSYSTSYSGDLYLRSASFLDYDPNSSSFTLDDIAEESSSLLYSAQSIESSENYGNSFLIQMHMGDHRDTGMVFASYPSSNYFAGQTSNASNLNTSMRPGSDGRFFREDQDEYTYSFYPDVDLTSCPYFDHSEYENSYLFSYSNLPGGYYAFLSSFCATHSIGSLSDIISFFSNECDLDNTLTGVGGDAVKRLLTSSLPTGNSSVFAAAYTLLARYLGTPARFVSGYKVTAKGKNSPEFVKESDIYYWAEVYQTGFGWKRVDPVSEANLKERPSEKIEITLSASPSSIEYDGEEHAPTLENNIKISEGELFPGDRIVSVSFASQWKTTEVKKFASIPFSNVIIQDKHGNDVTDKYEITKKYNATFEVVAMELQVYTEKHNFILSSSETTCEITKETLENLVHFVNFEAFQNKGYTYELSYVNGEIGTHKAGDTFENKPVITIYDPSGNDVTDQFKISGNYETVSIVKDGESHE